MIQSAELVDEAATVRLGQYLGETVLSGAVIYLRGTLGAGKTTLTRGILAAYGYAGAVKSPTYTLVEPYSLPGLTLYHFDLYRLGDPEELEYMGIRDYFSDNSVCVIEWPERGSGILPVADIDIELTPRGEKRQAQLSAGNKKGENILQAIKPHLTNVF